MPTLSWLTREKDVKGADSVAYRLLERDDQLSTSSSESGNMLIQGDNLEALKSLLPYYRGQVKCIYIDPPYNTRSAISVHYQDNIEHSQWLGIMSSRLTLLGEFLTNDGLIFIQIDDHEFAYLTVLADEIFGRSNRVNIISVKMSEATGVKMAHAEKRLPKMKEFILVYKKQNMPKIIPPYVKNDDWNEEYKEVICDISRDDLEILKDLMSQEKSSDEDVSNANEIRWVQRVAATL